MMNGWVRRLDPVTGRRRLMRIFPDGEVYDTPVTHLLARIDSALGEEDYVSWSGSPDAMVARFSSQASGRPASCRLGPGQADTLRYISRHPGCSASAATGRRNGYGRCYSDTIWALRDRGLLIIDTGIPHRFRLTITADGIEALRARPRES